jgi:hypothetical protein
LEFFFRFAEVTIHGKKYISHRRFLVVLGAKCMKIWIARAPKYFIQDASVVILF